jgi:peptidoglycan/xylan/chitin deacetylase (PgdA/CDA1 family)
VDFISRRATSLRFIGELARRCVKVRSGRFKLSTSQLVRHLAKYLSGPLIRFQKKDEYHCFDRCMEFEAQFGFKSTFFFFAEHLPTPHIWDCGYSHTDKVEFYGLRMTVRAMMREMLQRGWDIGLHGSYCSATDLSALKEEKRQMEESAGATVQAIRHHYLHYDVRVTPSLHERAGLKADSTHGFNRNIGFRSGTAFPYYCWSHQDQRSTNILEIPLHVMDGSLLSAQGLECDIDMATTYMKMMMDRIAAVGGCLTLNWHPSWLSLKPYREAYEWILREARERNAWGCTVQSLLRWVDEQTEE